MYDRMKDIDKRKAIQGALDKLHPQLIINCKKLCGTAYNQWGLDLLPHTLGQFLNMDLDRQYEIIFEDGKPEHYITRAMAMQLKSSTSTFYIKYRKPLINERELLPDYHYIGYSTDEDDEANKEVIECLTYHLENTLDFYDQYLVKEHYYNKASVADIARNLDIQPGRLGRDIKKALIKLKSLCSQV